MLKENLVGYYNSTYDFVSSNDLKVQAKECFGEDWEAEFDTNQIKELIKFLGYNDFTVVCHEHLEEDDIEVILKEFVQPLKDIKVLMAQLNRINMVSTDDLLILTEIDNIIDDNLIKLEH